MSHNRSDWFNPNNAAYRIRRTQLNLGTDSYFGTPYSCNYSRTYSSCENSISRLEGNTPILFPESIKAYLKLDENDNLKLTMEGFEIIKEYVDRKKKNLKKLIG